jgi:hypothetical protein
MMTTSIALVITGWTLAALEPAVYDTPRLALAANVDEVPTARGGLPATGVADDPADKYVRPLHSAKDPSPPVLRSRRLVADPSPADEEASRPEAARRATGSLLREPWVLIVGGSSLLLLILGGVLLLRWSHRRQKAVHFNSIMVGLPQQAPVGVQPALDAPPGSHTRRAA